MSNSKHVVTLIIPEGVEGSEADVEYRGIVDSIRRHYRTVDIPAKDLSDSIKTLLQNVSNSLAGASDLLSGYTLDEVEINAAISVTGKLALIAAEVEGGYKGSITFKFKRAPYK